MIPAVTSPADSHLAALLHVPGAQDHKYTRGVLGVWAGSQSYPGAAVLTCSAAVRSGAGMVRLVAPERVTNLVLARRPEVVPAIGRCQALVIGPGTDPADTPRAAELQQALAFALGEETEALPAVIDAGALPLLADRLLEGARCNAWHVLTPHAGEAAALLSTLGQASTRDAVEKESTAAAWTLSALSGATVLLKGTPTLVANHAAGVLLSLNAGPGWLATAGSGDVLAGVLGSLLATARAADESNLKKVYGDQLGPQASAAMVKSTLTEVSNGPESGQNTRIEATCHDLGNNIKEPQKSTKPLPDRYETEVNHSIVAIPTSCCENLSHAPQTSLAHEGNPVTLLTALAVRLHAKAAEIAAQTTGGSLGRPIAALDLVDALPNVLGALLSEVRQSTP
ncbi:ADP/ATP-dependent (S)-NAD(P)H-hydrate dehydratase [Actinomyces trachealis]|uniref:ADP-dependent NAD(P)H-hydrate dehydratase n=1 Tax=Actinomyces trachealis TaxID=2763540 RepID=UPI002E2BE08A|nr:ADP/ATP-dependent (S)-NAD(P)H-hydrate dehydratase [Actinomyces trachealis]